VPAVVLHPTVGTYQTDTQFSAGDTIFKDVTVPVNDGTSVLRSALFAPGAPQEGPQTVPYPGSISGALPAFLISPGGRRIPISLFAPVFQHGPNVISAQLEAPLFIGRTPGKWTFGIKFLQQTNTRPRPGQLEVVLNVIRRVRSKKRPLGGKHGHVTKGHGTPGSNFNGFGGLGGGTGGGPKFGFGFM
jgi:hypothetical protein